MVSWIGSKFKFDLDTSKLAEHSVYYFGMIATVFYLLRFLNFVIGRVHKSVTQVPVVKVDQPETDEVNPSQEEEITDDEKKEK